LAFDKATYTRRNMAERCSNRRKQWRGPATRYEKRAVNERAMVVLASIVLWLES
jgi:transposase